MPAAQPRKILATLPDQENVAQLLSSPDGRGVYLMSYSPEEMLVKKIDFGSPKLVQVGEIPNAVRPRFVGGTRQESLC